MDQEADVIRAKLVSLESAFEDFRANYLVLGGRHAESLVSMASISKGSRIAAQKSSSAARQTS